MDPDFVLLDNRHNVPADELSEYVSTNFGGNLLTLRQLEPFITEIKRRFKTLPRKAGVDGKYKTISGHRSFKSWCYAVLKRTDRTVRYMLQKAKPQEPKRAEIISADSLLSRVLTYIKRQELDEPTKNKIVAILNERIAEKVREDAAHH